MKGPRGALIFPWPERRWSFALPGFLILSLIAHAASFYIFQIEYPPTTRIIPPPAQVSVLAPTSTENKALLAWIAAEDPAIAAQAAEVLPPGIFEVAYRPSFGSVHAEPIVPKTASPVFSYPTALSPLALVERAALPRKPPPPARSPARTAVSFDETLAARAPAENPPMKFRATTVNAAPARFLLGVAETGEVRYRFLQESSGDKMLDQQAEEFLRTVSFAKSGEPLTWGMITFSWGSDAFSSPPTP